jgi:hypothetical protein
MRRLLRHRPSPAMAIALLALFVALGGSAMAAFIVSSNSQIGPNTIYGANKPSGANDNVVDGSIAAVDIKPSSIGSGRIADGTLTGADLVNNTLTGTQIDESSLAPVPNAQHLGGLPASGVGRIAMASDENFSGGFPFAPLTTATITAPAQGFVRLDGTLLAFDGRAASFCVDCEVGLRVRDVTAGTISPQSILVAGTSTRSTAIMMPVSWVFPVTPGVHSYALDAGQVAFQGGPFGLYNPVLIAQFVPFGGMGSSTSLGASGVRTSRASTTTTSRRAVRIGR